ncbi:MAG: ComF family protein [Lachnospiraceae bacterium]|nr:ComF family protein [Lachnospiraceae bacterium]
MRIRDVGRMMLDLAYPPRCPVCDGPAPPGRPVCPECARKIEPYRGSRCAKCSKPVRPGETLCRDCAGTRHLYQRGFAPFVYDDTMREVMAAFKYRGRREYAPFLAGLLFRFAKSRIADMRPDVIVPVPLHAERLAGRGYNQAEELAAELSLLTGIPMDSERLVRREKTAAMKKLGRQSRRESMRGVFAARRGNRDGERVLIVDDIYTTGSTVDSASCALTASGAAETDFLAVCIGGGFMVRY